MNDREKFDKTSLSDKKDFYSHLNMKDSTDADNAYVKRVCKYFKTKELGKYHDLYVQSDTLLLADIFQNFRNICLKCMNLILPKNSHLQNLHGKEF